jgi:hypothetical protein
MTDGQSASLPWCRAPIWSPWPDFCFLSDDCGFLELGHPLWWGCNLLVQLLLSLARTVTLGSEMRRTHDRILVSHLSLPQIGGPGPHNYIPQEQSGSVIPLGTGFPFVTSYDSKGYGGGILTRLHTGTNVKVKVMYYGWQSVGQSVWVSGTHLRPATKFSFSLKFSLDNCGFVILKHSLWREDGSVIYCCFWSSPVQSRMGLSPSGLKTIFYCPNSWDSTNLEGQVPMD